jgi:ABC-type polysaccharide/polyol phosphate export permease
MVQAPALSPTGTPECTGRQGPRAGSATEAYDYIIDSRDAPRFSSFVRSTVTDSWSYRWAIGSFVSNNLSRRYRRSALGFCWGMLGPLLTMCILSVVFSLVFHVETKKFVVYIFSGLLPWTFIQDSALQGSQCFIAAEPYLKKLSIPKIFFPLVSLGTDTINLLFSFASLLLLGVALGAQYNVSLLMLPAAILILVVANLGFILLYSVGTVYFRDLPHILQVTYSAFFYAVPIIYPMTVIPAEYRSLFKLNPFYWFINLFHSIIYDGCCPTLQEWSIATLLAIGTLAAGLFVLSSKNSRLVYRL